MVKEKVIGRARSPLRAEAANGTTTGVERKLITGSVPIALTIAGSDSGGGAGIQADLKTFLSLGVHGTSVITCLTAQNPKRVSGVQACTPDFIDKQLAAVFEELSPAAIKTGMLFSSSIIKRVAKFLSRHTRLPLVIDPVMVSTSGALLLQPAARKALIQKLLPLATLITPNLPETEVLIGKSLRDVEDMRNAARELHQRFDCAVLVKGGHLRGTKEAVDIFFNGSEELLLSAPFIHGVKTHGTGCTYSAAVTAYLSLGLPLAQSVTHAKQYITDAISNSRPARGHLVLHG